MRSSGYKQARADDADVLLLAARVLQARQPARAGLHVGVEHDHIARRVGGAQAAVDVDREAGVALALDHLDALDLAQRRHVLGPAAVVGDDDAHQLARRRLADAPHERRDPLGVAVAGDHHVDRLALLAVPRDRPAVAVGAGR